MLEAILLKVIDHGRKTNCDGLRQFQHFVKKSARRFALRGFLDLFRVELSDVGIRFSGQSFFLGDALNPGPIAKYIGAAARKMLNELLCAFGKLANNEKFAGGDVQ